MTRNRFIRIVATTACLFTLIPTLVFAAMKEKKGFTDPELFTRMPGFVGIDYKLLEYNKFDFLVQAGPKKNEKRSIEGRYAWYKYQLDPASGRTISNLQMVRNLQNAAKSIGGKVMYDGGPAGMFHGTTLMIPGKSGGETWVNVKTVADKIYELTIVEKEAMAQDVAANPMLDTMKQTGKVTLYINFDTGKATIKPDSLEIIDQIVAMLNADTTLNINIEGHTDNVGKDADNQKLSKLRSEAVKSALVAKGIAVTRLGARGFGSSEPIADNGTAEGRAKNRRVELVKR
jgi:outer membrane protein OmpA-like peptidoglycan-associated protein